MNEKDSYHKPDMAEQRARGIERALRKWQLWINSVVAGKKAIRSSGREPTLLELKNLAQKAVCELKFPQNVPLEVYWLCCVLVNYHVNGVFYFEKLIMPDWVMFGQSSYVEGLDFRKKRILPPMVWREVDFEFWTSNHSFFLHSSPSERETAKGWFPETQWAIVVSLNHPLRNIIKPGRPLKSILDGSIGVATKVESQKVKPTKCSHCGGSVLWDGEDKIFKCMACGRECI